MHVLPHVELLAVPLTISACVESISDSDKLRNIVNIKTYV